MLKLTKNQSEAIRALIEDPEQVQLRSQVLDEQSGVLLVWLTESDWYGLNANGQVITGQINNEEKSEVTDQRLINIILRSAADEFEELMFLKPEQAEDDFSCQFCGGTGDPDTSIELEKSVCYCGGLGWLPVCDPEANFDEPEKDEIPPDYLTFTDIQRNAIDGLKDDDIRRIDTEIMQNATGRFRKVAMIVGLSIQKLQDDIPDIPDDFYQNRVRHLVSIGELESVGDLNFMRFGEVRLVRNQ